MSDNDYKGQLNKELLAMMVCPKTKGPLRYDCENQLLISEQANLAYPVRNGIPVMLIDEAIEYPLTRDKII